MELLVLLLVNFLMLLFKMISRNSKFIDLAFGENNEPLLFWIFNWGKSAIANCDVPIFHTDKAKIGETFLKSLLHVHTTIIFHVKIWTTKYVFSNQSISWHLFLNLRRTRKKIQSVWSATLNIYSIQIFLITDILSAVLIIGDTDMMVSVGYPMKWI